jgi:hypothetical protein
MNKIKARTDQSDFENHFEFLNFQIDGFWLDEKLEGLYPGNSYKGLVPTLVYWMSVEEERDLVWNRIFPAEGEKTICPILMCSDDCDFSCTLIVAEIENWGNIIVWNRIGIDTTPFRRSENVGLQIDWFRKIGVLEFDLEEYLEMVQVFKKQFDEDKDL